MKNLKRLIIALCVLGVSAAIITQVYSLDGLTGVFFSLGEKENTTYASGYTDAAFRKVRLGMSSKDVLSLLGPPLGKYDLANPDRVLWQYSKEIEDLSFRVRNVIFRSNEVCTVIHEYYID